jgi:hypothetical protein
MQVVCEATQNASVNIQVGAFECLVSRGCITIKWDFTWSRRCLGCVVCSFIYHYNTLMGDDS